MIIDYTILIVSWVTLGTFFGYLVYFRVTLSLLIRSYKLGLYKKPPKENIRDTKEDK